MSETVEALVEAVEALDLDVDADELRRTCAARDVLDAKLALGVHAFEAAGAHEAQGAVNARTWLRQEARLCPPAAGRTVSTGARLVDFPELAHSVLAGRLSGGQLDIVLAHVRPRHRARFASHAPQLVPLLEPLTVDETARAMQEWRRRADAEDDGGLGDTTESELHHASTLDGVGVLRGHLDTDDNAVVDAALRAADSRDRALSLARRKADALTQICQHFLDHQGITPKGRRERPHLNVYVLPDPYGAPQARYTGSDAPVSPEAWGVLGCDAAWHRLLLDADSARLDYGRETRDWATDLYNAIVLRDGGCRAGACDAPASWCDVHHVDFWEHGGTTDVDNGVLLCRRHHRMIHKRGFHLKLLPDGTTELTTPTGEHLVNRPRGPGPRPGSLF